MGCLSKYFSIDNTDIVNFCILNGISPFLRFENNKSAILGAVRGGDLNVIQLITTKQYSSFDESQFDIIKTAFSETDNEHNDILHSACYEVL